MRDGIGAGLVAGDGESRCPFCRRIDRREYDAWTDDPDVVWFEPLNPVTPGHMLFVPVRHVVDALDDPHETAITVEVASRWARENYVGPCNLITSVGTAATQSIFHLHVHVIPRSGDDDLTLPWTRQQKENS